MKKFNIFILFTFFSLLIFGQPQKLPLNFWFYNSSGADFSNTHTAFKPLIKSNLTSIQNDTLPADAYNYFSFTHKKNRSFFARKLFFENLIQVDSADFGFTVDPLMNLELGKEKEDTSGTNFYTNTRGFIIKGHIGEKFAFVSTFKENQSVFPAYVAGIVDSLQVVPGQGRSKSFKDNGYDYAQATGSIMYQASNNVLIQTGTDKFFIGNGYRSMLLSDAAHSYPYVGATVYFLKRKIQYNAYYADLIHFERRPYTNSPEALFYRKGMNFHYISIKPLNWLELGIFDNVMIEKMDTSGSKPFNFISVNPVPFLPVLLYGFNNDNNASAGVNMKVNVKQKTIVYAQYFYDGKKDNVVKQAYQLGVKTFVVKYLGLGAEYNVSNPFTYASVNPQQAYTHYNQSLANPVGSNFTEKIVWMSFRYKRWFLFAKWNDITQDYAAGNVLMSENTAVSNQNTNRNVYTGKAGFIINPKTNLSLHAGITMWNYAKNNLQNTSTYIYFGLKTNLQNIYYDF